MGTFICFNILGCISYYGFELIHLFQYLSSLVVNEHNHHWYSDLLSSGIIGGAGAVLVFLPQIFILFFILGLLEDSGYLARGAMLIDKPLSRLD